MKKLFTSLCVLALAITLVACDEKKNPPKKKDDTTATKKVETPEKPVAPAAPSMKLSDINSPWKNSKVGFWAHYKPHTGLSGTIRHEIIKIHPDNIEFNMIKQETGKVFANRSVTFEDANRSYNDPNKLDAVSGIKEVTLKVNGKDIKCTYFKRQKGESSTETWICWDIPTYGGVVKSIRNGKLELELVDFGTK